MTGNAERDRFVWADLDRLRAEIRRMALDIPLADDLSVLGEPVAVAGRTAPNRLCACGEAGCDAAGNGAPGPLTVRRYTRFARGGFGVIRIEPTALRAEPGAGPPALCLTPATADAFAALARAVRAAAREACGRDVVLLLGLADPADAAEAERLAVPAGFDGVDAAHPERGEASAYPPADVQRALQAAREKRRAGATGPVMARGFTPLRHLAPHAAAGAVAEGVCDLAGFGRAALAYPGLARDVLERGALDPLRCCRACGACDRLRRAGEPAGCVLTDAEVYGSVYARMHRFSDARLRTEAGRCRVCAAPPCRAACPAGIDVPAFVSAFAEGDVGRAYAVLRRANPLPEMCSHLCPVGLQCEGACVETVLNGRPVPVRDIQAAVCRAARREGLVRPAAVPRAPAGRPVAVVGGGPAGIACAAALVGRGRRVVLLEGGDRLGGTPERVIPAVRLPDVQPEIENLLGAAREAGALEVRWGQTLGRTVRLETLRREFAAVVLACGVWQERALGPAAGAVDALTFLEEAKRGVRTSVPARVVILAGGDCAMDAARTARALGAADVFVLYAGTTADLHWHGAAEEFRSTGLHLLTLTEPLGYVTDAAGRLQGVRICRTLPGSAEAGGTRPCARVPDGESVLAAGLAVEAMGLEVDPALRAALPGVAFDARGRVAVAGDGSGRTSLDGVYAVGGLVNGGASVVQCIAEGLRAAEAVT
ncbi:MAG: FAD-dependent oxidoreductase [Lentisphaerae bacterium]|nr:FAD-dependent oxidoreductase [Lentisphaerota bacterium]